MSNIRQVFPTPHASPVAVISTGIITTSGSGEDRLTCKETKERRYSHRNTFAI